MVWYAFVFACLSVEWWLIKEELGIAYSNAAGTLLKCVGDVALILLPYWLLNPKWRWTALLPIWGAAVWGAVNMAYYRFWNDLIPPASIIMGGNVDGSLMEYGAALLRPSDMALLAPACASLIALRFIRPSKSEGFSRKVKLAFMGLSLLAGAIGQMSYFKTTYAWMNAISPRSVEESLSDHFFGGYTGQRKLYEYNGMVYYGLRFIYDAADLLSGSVTLDARQRLEISDFLKAYERKGGAARPARLDSLNVVYVIVESLNADMVGRSIGGHEVMPVLDSLAHMEGTVVFDNVVSQIKASSSSDGHLLLMTGLLPPDKAAYSIMYGSRNRFPSLADVLPDHSKYLLLADEGVCWNEGNTLRNFGLGEPLTIKDRPEYPVGVHGRDGAMMMQAMDIMKEVKEPFFMTLMTISMHIPFKEEAWPLPAFLRDAAELTQQEKDYANMCMQTDRWIGRLLRSVPENTLVIIASDHHQEVASDKGGATRAFFMAVNTGRTERISRTVGQLNLFPATLDILGIGTGYGGLGLSAFDGSVDGTMDSYGNVYGTPSQGALDTLGRAYGISDLIIRGDYFK